MRPLHLGFGTLLPRGIFGQNSAKPNVRPGKTLFALASTDGEEQKAFRLIKHGENFSNTTALRHLEIQNERLC